MNESKLIDRTILTNDYRTESELLNPAYYQESLSITGRDVDQLLRQLETMILIRKAEEKIGDGVTDGKIKCPCHLGIGQEAIAVGISESLRPTDRVFGAHRSHTHFLALNRNVNSLFAEVLGKVTGCSKGMGGSMHLFDQAHGFMGSVPIVAASVPIATGAGLAAKLDKKGDIAVSYFGDGAVEEGALQESLNLAAIMKLPVIFVCENNLFASHLHITQRQPISFTARFAQAHGIPARVFDGNNLVTVADVAANAIAQARNGEGPYYLEAITYRWRGHVGPREDIDVGVKRSEDLVLWKGRDPIGRLASALIQHGYLSDDSYYVMQEEVQQEIDLAWIEAEKAAYPATSTLLNLVYSDN